MVHIYIHSTNEMFQRSHLLESSLYSQRFTKFTLHLFLFFVRYGNKKKSRDSCAAETLSVYNQNSSSIILMDGPAVSTGQAACDGCILNTIYISNSIDWEQPGKFTQIIWINISFLSILQVISSRHQMKIKIFISECMWCYWVWNWYSITNYNRCYIEVGRKIKGRSVWGNLMISNSWSKKCVFHPCNLHKIWCTFWNQNRALKLSVKGHCTHISHL